MRNTCHDLLNLNHASRKLYNRKQNSYLSIYYFFQIPTIIDPVTISWIIVGAVTIAIGSSVLPAVRAARLHAVEALRHD